MWVLQLTITSSTSLFAALIAVNGTLHNSRPSGDGKATCGDDEDALKYSVQSWHLIHLSTLQLT